MIELRDYQVEALAHMHNGCILVGGVGSGKSRTALAYYYTLFGGMVNTKNYVRMKNPMDLYIITPAKKRDSLEWLDEMKPFKLFNLYNIKIVVDSWNNIQKYKDVHDAFFIFDEQRVVGWGAWTKAFISITRKNRWILLSATPGDVWSDYIPVFVANGFYRNKTDFNNQHVIFNYFTSYPSIKGYFNEGKLIKYRNHVLVQMEDQRKTHQVHVDINCSYDICLYRQIERTRWNIYTNEPIKNASEYCQVLRRVVNSDISKQSAMLEILAERNKAIIFYTYDYELEIIKHTLDEAKWPYSQWNGHRHEQILGGPAWAYLVQYSAGSDAWNCILTDTMIFYDESYSYRTMIQAAGRIDRMNTPFDELFYYHLRTKSKIDNGIRMALKRKKDFNASNFAPKFAYLTTSMMEV